MGWLFAVALGLQERRRAAVLRALPPIALGHAASIAVVIAVVGAARFVVPMPVVRIVSAGVLVAFGVYKLVRSYVHPRWVGMRVGFRDLTVWSFLMSSAHGAGLMLVPVLLQLPAEPGTSGVPLADDHSRHVQAATAGSAATSLAALAVHTAALFLVMATIAVLVFETLGLELLRRAWINLDLVWSFALIVAGVVTLLVA
jgi:hypothetical protein